MENNPENTGQRPGGSKISKTISIVVVLLIIAGIYYLVTLPNSSSTKDSSQTASTTAEIVFTGPISEIVGSGKDYECTSTVTNGGVVIAGRVYVSGNSIRGNYITDVPVAGKISASMIADDSLVYVWNPITNEGYTAPRADSPEGQAASESGDASFGVDDEKMYSCIPWVADPAAFEVPTDVIFQDASV